MNPGMPRPAMSPRQLCARQRLTERRIEVARQTGTREKSCPRHQHRDQKRYGSGQQNRTDAAMVGNRQRQHGIGRGFQRGDKHPGNADAPQTAAGARGKRLNGGRRCRVHDEVSDCRGVSSSRVSARAANAGSCVTMTTTRPCVCARSSSAAIRRAAVASSSALVGSSSNVTGACARKARAKPTRWRSPPDSCAASASSGTSICARASA